MLRFVAEDYPRTLLELERRFSDEAACRAYLFALRWPEGFVCENCGGQTARLMTSRGLWRCDDCRRRTSAAACASRSLAAQTLASGHTSRCDRSRASGRLPRRVHVPLQPPHIIVTGQTLLPIGSTGGTSGTRTVSHTDRPQPIGGRCVK